MSFLPPLEPTVMSFIGEPKSGKSTLIKACMHYYAKKKYFRFGLCISGSSWNGDYDFLPQVALWDKWDEQRFKEYIDRLEARARELKKQNKKLPPSFVIFDDLLGQLANSDWVKSFFSRYRQYNITCLLANQYAGESKGCSTLLRSVTEIAFMFPSMMQNQLDAMKGAWGGYFKTDAEFKSAMIDVKKRKYACMVYQKSGNSKKECYMSFLVTPAPDFKMKF